MFDLMDLFLLRRGTPADDRTLAFRRIEGNASAKVIYFLPWHAPFGFARQAGLAPLDFLACYEMPPAIVSSEPALCAQAMLSLVDDAEGLLKDRGIRAENAVIVGLSVGTYPATYLANRIGARLCSVASADRADLAVWDSPATRIVKKRAVQQGLRLSDFSEALAGTHPAQNLAYIAKGSVFVVGERDPFVPPPRMAGLLRGIETHAPDAHVIKLDAGHFKTLMASGRYQRSLLGIEAPRTSWQFRMPKFFAAVSGQVSAPK
jgi:pimeloyl-ACP methyl ester carboxylesterase